MCQTLFQVRQRELNHLSMNGQSISYSILVRTLLRNLNKLPLQTLVPRWLIIAQVKTSYWKIVNNLLNKCKVPRR